MGRSTRVPWSRVPPGEWYTAPSQPPWRGGRGGGAGSWQRHKTTGAKDYTKIECTQCDRWVYKFRLAQCDHRCLCGAKFPGQPKGGGRSPAAQQAPPAKETQVVRFLESLAQQSGAKAEAAKSYLAVAKASPPKEKTGDQLGANAVAEVTARVNKAQAAFTKAQTSKAKLLRSLAEADDRLRTAAEQLAEAEKERYRIFKQVVPAPAPPAPSQDKGLRIQDLVRGEFPLDFGCTAAEAATLGEGEKQAIEARTAEIRSMVTEAAKAAFAPIMAEIERRQKEVTETYQQLRKRQRGETPAPTVTPVQVEEDAAEVAVPGTPRVSEVSSQEASRIKAEKEAEKEQAEDTAKGSATQQLRTERLQAAEEQVKKESEALLAELRRSTGSLV